MSPHSNVQLQKISIPPPPPSIGSLWDGRAGGGGRRGGGEEALKPKPSVGVLLIFWHSTNTSILLTSLDALNSLIQCFPNLFYFPLQKLIYSVLSVLQCSQLFYTICLPFFLARFNKNPKKGVKYLQDNGLLGPEPDDVSEFLHTDERLDKVILIIIILYP